uniref:V-set and transmembrane domain-containing protein 2-like protein n=1 Tax=Sinocyclocheilus rhinocerous TaxID=307959 RepID=A0A673MW41_9TELE
MKRQSKNTALKLKVHSHLLACFSYSTARVASLSTQKRILCDMNASHVSAVFTEVPHDITAQSGQDVEMACSFRGAGSPSYSLEIQWWYIRNHREWTDKQTWSTNQVVPQNEMSKDATKISVVKVAGSNISHKLRLSSVKPADEGTYECHVIDFSDSKLRHHRVRAYLQVKRPEGNLQLLPHPHHPNTHNSLRQPLN